MKGRMSTEREPVPSPQTKEQGKEQIRFGGESDMVKCPMWSVLVVSSLCVTQTHAHSHALMYVHMYVGINTIWQTSALCVRHT